MKKHKQTKKDFPEKMFSQIDRVMKDYHKQNDVRGATAFAVKMKERMEFILQALDKESQGSKEERIELLGKYQKEIENSIIKSEISDMFQRESRTPSYIGFMLNNERRDL